MTSPDSTQWVVVRREPTPEMLEAYTYAYSLGDPDDRLSYSGMLDGHAAMIAASPPIPEEALERAARILHPEAWAEAERLLALQFNGEPRPATDMARHIKMRSLNKVRAALAALGAP